MICLVILHTSLIFISFCSAYSYVLYTLPLNKSWHEWIFHVISCFNSLKWWLLCPQTLTWLKFFMLIKIQLNEINIYSLQLTFLSQMDLSSVQILLKVPEDLTSYMHSYMHATSIHCFKAISSDTDCFKTMSQYVVQLYVESFFLEQIGSHNRDTF